MIEISARGVSDASVWDLTLILRLYPNIPTM
jgi:hypothetical protein